MQCFSAWRYSRDIRPLRHSTRYRILRDERKQLMFAVMGITGNVGGAVADTLLQHGKKVRGIVRDAAKARTWQENGVELVTSNYDDHLATAFSGVEGVFVMIPSNM